ncbi:MAG TPA: hypothetical protein VFX05_10315, partial [Casimicrobiaceae bacterium]|nr:hypothetical protein [Casimicrobiaceae bacterium]
VPIAEPRRESRTQEGAADAASAEAPSAPTPLDRGDAAERSVAAAQAPKLGTGHGRSETSYARQVAFERATRDPVEIVAVQYDRYENLVAQGVIVAPPVLARTPRPFPGGRFVPDPR